MVKRQAARVELAETVLVAKQGTVGDQRTAQEELFQGAIEPDGDGSGAIEQFDILRLDKSAAAERDDAARAARGLLDDAPPGLVLDFAKSRFASLGENLRDAAALGQFDLLIEIDKPPGQALGEQLPDGGLPAAHKADQVNRIFCDVGRSNRHRVQFRT